MFMVSAQGNSFKFQAHTDELNVESLAQKLTQWDKTDREKVTSIFTWITDNIGYYIKPAWNVKKYKAPVIVEEDTTTLLKPLNLRVSENVLRRKVAVCDGYARLFKTLCDYAGIPSEIISGYARTGRERSDSKFISNHSWNAVYLDSSWYLLDATWAAGYLSYSGEFVRHYDDSYFLSSARRFIVDHYPEDLKWTLLNEPLAFREYKFSPFRYGAYYKNRIEQVFPSKGIIEATVGDTIMIALTSPINEKKLIISDKSLLDSTEVSQPEDRSKITVNGNTQYYKYIVHSDTVQWLHIIMNEEPILRYRLVVYKKSGN